MEIYQKNSLYKLCPEISLSQRLYGNKTWPMLENFMLVEWTTSSMDFKLKSTYVLVEWEEKDWLWCGKNGRREEDEREVNGTLQWRESGEKVQRLQHF